MDELPPLFIHVGLMKTGTTFLQQEIFPKLKSVRYIDGRDVSFHLYRLVLEEDASYDPSLAQKYFYPLIERGPSLISHEILSGDPYYLDANQPRTTDRLAQLFPHARIIVTIRRQDTLLQSMYLKRLRDGDALSLGDFLRYKDGTFRNYYAMEGRHINLPVLKYDHIAERYSCRFGGRVDFMAYEHLRQDVTGFVRSICDRIGESEAPSFHNVDSNRSYGYYQHRLARILNPLFRSSRNPYGLIPYIRLPGAKPIRLNRVLAHDWVHRWFDLWPKNKIVMRKDISKAIMEYYSPSNAEFDQKWQVGLQKWGYIIDDQN